MHVNKTILSVTMEADNYFGFGTYTGHLIRSAIIERMQNLFCSKTVKCECDTCNNKECLVKKTLVFKSDTDGKMFLNPVIIESNFCSSFDYIAERKLEFKVLLLGDATTYTEEMKKVLSELTFKDGRDIVVFKASNIEVSEYEIDTEIKNEKYNGKIKVTFENYISKPRNKSKFSDEIKHTDKLEFDKLVRAATQKITSLMNTCCNEERFDFRRFTDNQYDVRTIESKVTEQSFERKSSRKNTNNRVKAISGYVIYEGNIDEAYELLKLVSELHIGKMTTMGFGKLTVEKLDD